MTHSEHDVTPHLTPEQCEAFVTGAMTAPAAANATEHIAACTQCRTSVAAMRHLQEATRALPSEIAPPVDLWPAIRHGLTQSARPPEAPPASRERSIVPGRLPEPRLRRNAWSGRRRVLAAALFLIIGSATILVARQLHVPSTALSRSGSVAEDWQPPVQPWGLSPTSADSAELARFQRAFAVVLAEEQQTLQPATAATVTGSLLVIDAAISQLEAALRGEVDPKASARLRARLLWTNQQKAALAELVWPAA